MDSNEKILNNLYKKLTREIIALESLIGKTNEGALKKTLEKQKTGYRRHRFKVEHEMQQSKLAIKAPSQISLAMLRTALFIKNLGRIKESKIATKTIKNSTDEIIHLTKSLKKHRLSNERTQYIANSFIKFEQGNIDSLKSYL